MLLLEIIREFKRQSQLPFKIILMENGVLSEEFKSLGPTYIWQPPGFSFGQTSSLQPLKAILAKVAMLFKGLWILASIRQTTVTFSNTITNGHLHTKLLLLRCKFITYVHELEISIKALTNTRTLRAVLDHSDFYFAGSSAVKDNLQKRHGVPGNKIDVVYSSIPVLERTKAGYQKEIDLIKEGLSLPGDAFIVGTAAQSEWRKGFDLFFPLIKLYHKLYPDNKAHFVWLGVDPVGEFYHRDMVDFENYKIQRTHLVVHGADYLNYMALFDVHLLMSREDPYPLVVLDAATFGTPTIAFQDAGGTPEFVEADCGYCVAYGDLYEMAQAIRELENNEPRRRELGRNAAEKVKVRHDQKIATGKIIERINELSW